MKPILAGRIVCAGVTLASLAAFSPAPDRWTAVLDLTMGESRGPDYAFAFIRTISVGPAGQIAVRRYEDRAIDLFDSTGTRIRRLGRRGKGPGEFNAVSSIDWIGHELVVRDDNLRRITVFTDSGKLLRVEPLFQMHTKADAWLSSWRVMTSGRWVAERTERRAGGEISDIVLLDSTGKMKTLDVLIDGPTDIPLGGPVSLGYQPFEDRSLWYATPGGAGLTIVDWKAVKGRAHFCVRNYGPSFELRYDRTFDHVPQPITRREVDSVVDVADYKLRNEAVGPGMVVPGIVKSAPKSLLREGLYVPAYHPAVTAIAAGRDGTVWLRREDRGAADVLWQALNDRGIIVGELTLPANLDVQDADSQHLWGVRTLEFEVDEVVRYRIHRP